MPNFFYIILITGLFLDLISKYFAQIYFQEKIKIISDFFYLKFVENSGIAFSTEVPFLKILTIILIILIFCYYFKEVKNKKNDIFSDVGFSLILSGAIGNAYGRLFNGKVVDFIGIEYFFIFNLADLFISFGAIVLIYKSIFKIQKN